MRAGAFETRRAFSLLSVVASRDSRVSQSVHARSRGLSNGSLCRERSRKEREQLRERVKGPRAVANRSYVIYLRVLYIRLDYINCLPFLSLFVLASSLVGPRVRLSVTKNPPFCSRVSDYYRYTPYKRERRVPISESGLEHENIYGESVVLGRAVYDRPVFLWVHCPASFSFSSLVVSLVGEPAVLMPMRFKNDVLVIFCTYLLHFLVYSFLIRSRISLIYLFLVERRK